MNYVSFSPHFPSSYKNFCVSLHKRGVNVLGLADAPYDSLHINLRSALTEYFRVQDCHNYDELVRALGYFTFHYGKIDRIESHNEYWLESDARLRTDFNIPGFHNIDMPRVKRKSLMKTMFKKAHIKTAQGWVVDNLDEAKVLVDKLGFPVVAKPDIGVGAQKTFKIQNQTDLGLFFQNKFPVDYIFEEFIKGPILTFDGLTNQQGEIVFSSSMHFGEGVMDLVNQNLDLFYYTLRQIPADLESAGRRLVSAYHIKERFFHFEFFRTPEGELVGLEVNMRPPGGLTTDMFNYANDIDIYDEYANVVVNNRFSSEVTRPYFCAYIGRRNNHAYLHSHDEALTRFNNLIVYHEPISGAFAPAIGDYGYLLRSPDLDILTTATNWFFQQP
jgi:hypothetical protein